MAVNRRQFLRVTAAATAAAMMDPAGLAPLPPKPRIVTVKINDRDMSHYFSPEPDLLELSIQQELVRVGGTPGVMEVKSMRVVRVSPRFSHLPPALGPLPTEEDWREAERQGKAYMKGAGIWKGNT